MDITNITQVAVLVPVVIGLVAVAKASGFPSRWSMLLSLVLGIGLNFLVGHGFSAANLVGGIVIGLSASGLWSGTKAAIRGGAINPGTQL